MNLKSKIELIQNKVETLSEELNSLKGQKQLLKKQIKDSVNVVKEYNKNILLYRKCVEFLTIVQKTTKDKIKKGFENIISHALRFILEDESYGFTLEFSRRGNLQQVDFNIKTPTCETPHDPLDTQAGGVLDIISLALRIALLELARPKIPGFLILDEPFKHLHMTPTYYLENADKFLRVINKRIKRQIIMVTGREQFLDEAENIIKMEE